MKVNEIFDAKGFLYGLAALLPVALIYMIYPKVVIFYVGLVSISLAIVMRKLHFTLLNSFVHYLVVIFCLTILYFASPSKILFILLCATMAFVSVYITRYGSKLRTLGNYIFIPMVYITCELRAGSGVDLDIGQYYDFIKFSPLALLGVGFLSFFNEEEGLNLGEPEQGWLRASLIILASVMISTTVALVFDLHHLQWVVWSSASIVLASFDKTKQKLEERVVGASIGLPMGMIFLWLFPSYHHLYFLAPAFILMTLISFKYYPVAFGLRCFFVALAAGIVGESFELGWERVQGVAVGGAIGIACSYAAVIIGKISAQKR